MKSALVPAATLVIGILLGIVLVRVTETPAPEAAGPAQDDGLREELTVLSRRIDLLAEAFAAAPVSSGTPSVDVPEDVLKRLAVLERRVSRAPTPDGRPGTDRSETSAPAQAHHYTIRASAPRSGSARLRVVQLRPGTTAIPRESGSDLRG